jgi:CDP-diacylglycerol--glycerol-3-phosphate 3-phosphatidyltransferase
VNTANKITILRIVLLPLLVVFLIKDEALFNWLALAVYLLAAATDWLDGYVARTSNEVTTLGKLLDPVADKLLFTAALLPLVSRGEVADWMAILLLGREFLVSGLRSVASSEGVIIAAGTMGKYKTGFSITALAMLIVGGWFTLPGHLFLWLTLILSLVSGGKYFYAYRHHLVTSGSKPTDG